MELNKNGDGVPDIPSKDAAKSLLKDKLKGLKKEYTELVVELYSAGVPESLIHKGTRINGTLYRMLQGFIEASVN